MELLYSAAIGMKVNRPNESRLFTKYSFFFLPSSVRGLCNGRRKRSRTFRNPCERHEHNDKCNSTLGKLGRTEKSDIFMLLPSLAFVPNCQGLEHSRFITVLVLDVGTRVKVGSLFLYENFINI